MTSLVASRFSPILGLVVTRTTYERLPIARFYVSKKGKWHNKLLIAMSDLMIDVE